jgi:hypothetical protein
MRDEKHTQTRGARALRASRVLSESLTGVDYCLFGFFLPQTSFVLCFSLRRLPGWASRKGVIGSCATGSLAVVLSNSDGRLYFFHAARPGTKHMSRYQDVPPFLPINRFAWLRGVFWIFYAFATDPGTPRSGVLISPPTLRKSSRTEPPLTFHLT